MILSSIYAAKHQGARTGEGGGSEKSCPRRSIIVQEVLVLFNFSKTRKSEFK